MAGSVHASGKTEGDNSTGLALTPNDIEQVADQSVWDAFDTGKQGSPR